MKQKDARKIDLTFLKLYHLDGWTLQKIADKYDITRQRAEQRVRRAVEWARSL